MPASRLPGRVVVLGLALAFITIACGDSSEEEPASTTATTAVGTLPAPAVGEADAGAGASTTAPASGDVASSPTSLAPRSLEPTPSQQEGPYYPVEKPDDRDSDLTQVNGLAGVPAGNIVLVDGVLLTTGGEPIEGAVVEVWQTDSQGIYLHPDDPKTADRDPNFQFYGEAITGSDGTWTFRTIDPGYYEPRPRHLHVKVRVDSDEVLTTQIYFADDDQAAGEDPLLIASFEAGVDDDGASVLIAEHLIVLDI